MGLLVIDRNKCKKDGICGEECPMSIIKMGDENDGYPHLLPGAEEACLRCGHCVSVCPHGALRHTSIPMERCIDPFKKIWSSTRNRPSSFCEAADPSGYTGTNR